MSNQEVAKILREIGEFLEMKGVAFKPRAYEKAAEAVANLESEVKEVYKDGGFKALEKIPGIGVSIAEKIEELLKTGGLKYYQKLKKETPVNLDELTRVEGLGPKQVQVLYKKLKIKNLKELEQAARRGRISQLSGFGKKSEEKILRGVDFLKKFGGRYLLSEAWSEANAIRDRLSRLKEVKIIEIAGSIRRQKETVGDLDFLAVLKKTAGSAGAKKIMDYFTAMPEVAAVFAKGATKTMIKLKSGLDADLRVVPEKSYGAALNYFTGSKDHNIKLRQMAIKRGYKLSEYGLFKGNRQIAGETEDNLYKKLGMAYVEPELRENNGEIEIAQKNKLPKLIDYDDLKGDLQVQTDWSDGTASIEAMARAARQFGLEYILVTDHSKRLAMANGLDEKRLSLQINEIDKVNVKFKKEGLEMTILKGVECDILKDGTMDLSDRALEKLDIVGGSVHSFFDLPKKAQTARLCRAMENPNVDIIMHLTGRLLLRRKPIDLDIDEVIKTAHATKTVLEINAFPDRLDLKDDYIRLSVAVGVKMAISSDSHALNHFEVLKFGVAQARRGWASKKDIINAWPLKTMLAMLKNS